MSENSLARHALNSLSQGDASGSEWFTTVKFLMNHLGMASHFQNPKLLTPEKFKSLCKTNLKELLTKQWVTQISDERAGESGGNKLRFYKTFKLSFCREPYLDSISNFTLRKIITKFRCSDHCLEIEKGRHIKLKLEERICKLCKSDIETELHFIQDCPAYSDIRSHFFGNHSTYNWSEILQCKDKKGAFNLANFLTKAFSRRAKLLAVPEK